MQNTRPSVGIAVIVLNDNNKVLIGMRKGSHGEDTYSIPGGHLEFNESFESCAKRETKEETGLEIELSSQHPVAVTNDLFLDEGRHYVTLFMKARSIGKLDMNHYHEKFLNPEWYSWNKLPQPLFKPLQNLIDEEYYPFY